jgi:hypothetical protein
VTTAARTRRAISAEHRSDFDRLVAALPFDPMHPPETGGEDLVMHLARVFALDAVIRAHADGRRVYEAVRDLGALVREAHDELNQQRRTAHLAAARSIADGKVPSVNAKAVAAYAAARDRADFLDAMGNLHPILAASKRAAEAMNAEPVTTAALIVTYAAVLGAHESVRRGVRLAVRCCWPKAWRCLTVTPGGSRQPPAWQVSPGTPCATPTPRTSARIPAWMPSHFPSASAIPIPRSRRAGTFTSERTGHGNLPASRQAWASRDGWAVVQQDSSAARVLHC